MGRYGNSTIKGICDNMTCEASEIMRKHSVPRDERKYITEMIEEAWYQAKQANRCACVLEKKLEEMGINTAALVIESFKRGG